jgi:hypothetical protein
MYHITVSCTGISESAALAGLGDIAEEFVHRPWQQSVRCEWESGRLVLQATNDYDANGQALLGEFSDAVCACLPIEDNELRFSVESVRQVPGSEA